MGDAAGPFFGACADWAHEASPASMGGCSAPLSDGAKTAIGVCVPLAVIAGVAVACGVYRRRKAGAGYEALAGG
jgi:hypothetical protein